MFEVLFALLGVFWFLVVPILGLIAFFKSNSLSDKTEKLERKILTLQTKLADTLKKQPKQKVSKEEPSEIPLEPYPNTQAPVEEVADHSLSQQPPPPETGSQILAEKSKSQPKAVFEKPKEQWAQEQASSQAGPPVAPPNPMFSWIKENWAGFVGVSILVLGIAFGAIYLSFNTSPFWRFAQLIGVGIIFLVASLILKRRQLWQDLSAWLLAASGAVVLFTVVGSGYFAELRFYENDLTGLILLLAALFYNLLLAYLASKQAVASLHVLISLLALCVAPQENIVFGAAVIVTLGGICLSIRQHWNYNLIMTLSAFTLFHGLWYFSLPKESIDSFLLLGIASTIIVGGLCLLTHYREIYQSTHIRQNVFTHTGVWILIAFQLFWYSQNVSFIFLPLGLLALLGIGMALYARSKGITWLFLIDALSSQALIVLTILSLAKLEFGYDILIYAAMIESLCFALVAYANREAMLSRVGGYVFFIFVIFLSIYLLSQDPISTVKLFSLGASAILLLYLSRWYLSRRDENKDIFFMQNWVRNFPLIIDLACFTLGSIILWFAVPSALISYPIICAVLLVLALNTNLNQSNDHKLLFSFFLLEMIVYCWLELFVLDNTLQILTYFAIPSLVLLFCLLPLHFFQSNILYQGSSEVKVFNISYDDCWAYVFFTHLGIIGCTYLWTVNTFMPGIFLLAAGLLLFELSHFNLIKSSQERGVLLACGLRNTALMYMFVFIGFYTLLYIASEASLFAIISIRAVFSLIVITTCLYWHFSKQINNTSENELLSTRWSIISAPSLQAVSFDIALIFAIMFTVTEFSAPIHPIGYGLLALLLLIPKLDGILPKRKDLYALLLLYALCVQVAVVSSKWASPLQDWYHTTHITGPLSMVIALIASYFYIQKTQKNKSGNEIPFYKKDGVLLSYLPIFIALALFLLWRFDKAYLTMLWVGEIFAIVVVGFALKHRLLVQIALTFLAFCVLRLLFYDLAQTDLLIRAIVFVIVGLLMVFIHMIYKKFADRLK